MAQTLFHQIKRLNDTNKVMLSHKWHVCANLFVCGLQMKNILPFARVKGRHGVKVITFNHFSTTRESYPISPSSMVSQKSIELSFNPEDAPLFLRSVLLYNYKRINCTEIGITTRSPVHFSRWYKTNFKLSSNDKIFSHHENSAERTSRILTHPSLHFKCYSTSKYKHNRNEWKWALGKLAIFDQ